MLLNSAVKPPLEPPLDAGGGISRGGGGVLNGDGSWNDDGGLKGDGAGGAAAPRPPLSSVRSIWVNPPAFTAGAGAPGMPIPGCGGAAADGAGKAMSRPCGDGKPVSARCSFDPIGG